MGRSLFTLTAVATLYVVWHSEYLFHGVLRASCLATCITLTPLALTMRALRWGYTEFSNNTLSNTITLGIGHSLYQWIYLPSPCTTPPHLTIAFYVGIIHFGYSLCTACYNVGRAPVRAAATNILKALKKNRRRTTITLVTALACVAACSLPDRTGLQTHTPRAHIPPISLLHFVRNNTPTEQHVPFNPRTHSLTKRCPIPIPDPRIQHTRSVDPPNKNLHENEAPPHHIPQVGSSPPPSTSSTNPTRPRTHAPHSGYMPPHGHVTTSPRTCCVWCRC